MESLCSRLSAVQEELMCIYEEGDRTLATQVRHWQLIRQEQVLLHAARQQGHTRIGMQAVPSLAASQANAKNAIEMHLLLQSLLQSPYAKEPWTLSETSRDLYLAPPSHTLKKSGQTIEVLFDGDENNSMQYTKWLQVFYTDDRGMWKRVPSVCDATGIFFDRNGHREYYVRFEKEAMRFSVTGTWQAVDEGKIYSSVVPVASSTPTTGPPRGPAVHPDGVSATGHTSPNWDCSRHSPLPSGGGEDSGEEEKVHTRPEYTDHSYNRQTSPPSFRGEQSVGGEQHRERARGLGVPAGDVPEVPRAADKETKSPEPISKRGPGRPRKGPSAAGETTTDGEPRSKKRPRDRTGGYRTRKRRRTKRWATPPRERGPDHVDLNATNKNEGRPNGPVNCSPPTPNPPDLSAIPPTPGVRVAGQSTPAGTSRAPPTLVAEPDAGRTPAAAAAGLRSATPGSTARIRRPRVGPGPPCLLIIKGTPNGVKCLRYRLKTQHPSTFQFVSTTWQWVPATGSSRVGRARILVMCSDQTQRNIFLDTVKIPAGMTVEQCSMLAI
ncbi:E2 [Rattus norvegicus papillomavirus 3]|uniref:Regulatory protein E2 n=1 Tax=Rattus norvegicus papillomavirus 3 TaxID=1756445 RepID=A0A0S2LV87_MNPV|nr:E2 [Rattus norvegicus papillomavirus 3]ALO65144.1 E2 [Rattus norvegicus papillomavirus 3]